jgi:imidazolonepropionase-like amidohydrolase
MHRILLTILLVILLGVSLVRSRQRVNQNPLVLNHVTVIDVTGGQSQTDMTVHISEGRIVRIRKSSEVSLEIDTHVIDATGKFLIPGLWDMHVHVLREKRARKAFPKLLANGVLGIRDMGSPVNEPQIKEWHRRIEEDELLAPRIVAAGPMMDGAAPMFPRLSISAKDAVEARQGVTFLKQSGADFIKVYSLLSSEAYFAIANEAKKQNIPFAGHVPDEVNARDASDAGHKSIEHLSGVLLACSASEDELRHELLQARAQTDPAVLYEALKLIESKGAQTFSKEKAETLFRHFVRNRTWQVPTLVGIWQVHNFFRQKKGSGLHRSRSSSPLTATRASYSGVTCCPDFSFSEGFASDEEDIVRDLLQGMKEAGVEFMAGTDTPNIWGVVGQSLHEELALFVRAGFTPMEALQTATRNPAAYLGLLDSFGTVEEGKFADLVLLDANPLEEITNTQKIAAVILRGRLFSKSELLGGSAELHS